MFTTSPTLQSAKRRVRERVRNEGHAEAVGIDGDERQADAIDGDRALAGHLPRQSRGGTRNVNVRPLAVVAALDERAGAVDVPA